MLQKSGRLVLWEAMFILELHSAETQGKCECLSAYIRLVYTDITCCLPAQDSVAATVLVTYNAPWRKK